MSAGDFGGWKMFVPQKVIAIRRAKMIVVAGGLLGLVIVGMIGVYLFT